MNFREFFIGISTLLGILGYFSITPDVIKDEYQETKEVYFTDKIPVHKILDPKDKDDEF